MDNLVENVENYFHMHAGIYSKPVTCQNETGFNITMSAPGTTATIRRYTLYMKTTLLSFLLKNLTIYNEKSVCIPTENTL